MRRVIILDDEPLIANLMGEMIAEDPTLEISAIALTKDDFLKQVAAQEFDAALVDISVGYRDAGMDILRELRLREKSLPVIMLSAHDEIDFAIPCLQAGARGYINKNYICTDIIPGLNAVIDGKMFVAGRHGDDILARYLKAVNSSIY